MCKRNKVTLKKTKKCILLYSLLTLTACSAIQEATDGTPLILLTKLIPEAIESTSVPKFENIPGPDLYINIENANGKYVVSRITSDKKSGSIKLNDLAPNKELQEFYEQRYKGPVFSDLLYQKALKDALIGVDRKALIAKYEEVLRSKFLETLKKEREDNVKVLKVGYSEIFEKYAPSYERKFGTAKMKLIVDDLSGFYDNSVSVDKLAAINKTELKSEQVNLEPIIVTVDTTLENFDAALTDNKSKLQTTANQYRQKVIDALLSYEKFMSDSTSTLKLKDKNIYSYNNYNLKVSMPDVFEIKNTNTPEIPVTLVVKSKDFYNIYPHANISDNNLMLSFDRDALELINKTNYFLQIKSISVYYESKITTYQCELELPPEGKQTESAILSKILSDVKHDYPYMTAAIANKTTINFGFAVKYRVMEQNIDKTLYKTNNYNLLKLLSSL